MGDAGLIKPLADDGGGALLLPAQLGVAMQVATDGDQVGLARGNGTAHGGEGRGFHDDVQGYSPVPHTSATGGRGAGPGGLDGAGSDQVGSAALSQQVDEGLDLLGAIRGRHQKGILRIDDDDVLHAE